MVYSKSQGVSSKCLGRGSNLVTWMQTKKYAGGQSCNMQKQESARSSTFHKLKSLEPCWVSKFPPNNLLYQFYQSVLQPPIKAMLLCPPAPNLPIHFPRPLKPSDSSLSPWPHGWLYSCTWIMLVNRESTSHLGHTGCFSPTPKKTREPIHSHLNPWQYWRLHGSCFWWPHVENRSGKWSW